MSNLFKTPNINKKAICITDDALFGGIISSYFNQENEYFVVIDSQRLARPDALNEIIKRVNLIARIKPEFIIFAGATKEIIQRIINFFPNQKKIIIEKINEIDTELKKEFKFNDLEKLHCNTETIAYGLLIAKLEKKHLFFDNNAPSLKNKLIHSEHFVICDDNRWTIPIIASNYAYSINAKLQFLPGINEDEIKNIYSDVSNSQYFKTTKRGEDASRNLISQKIKFSSYFSEREINASFVTFITKGIPYGYFFPEIPSTHLFSYPDLSLIIPNNIYYANNVVETRSALLIDPDIFPEDWGENETNFVSHQLGKMGVYRKELRGEEAKVHKTGLYIEWFPYDLLYICSHVDKMDGRELTIRFFDREGNEHNIIIEEASSFGLTEEGEGDNRLVEVTNFISFISIDGFDWREKRERSNGKVTKNTIEDFYAIPREKWEIINEREIPFVSNSARIGLRDGDYQAAFQNVSAMGLPTIFNNACVSFYTFALRFLFAGAKGYIGTLAPINTNDAKEIAQTFFSNLSSSRPLPLLLWEIQKEYFTNSIERIYIFIGTHFCNILPPTVNTNSYIKQKVSFQIKKLEKQLINQRLKDNSRLERVINFLKRIDLDN